MDDPVAILERQAETRVAELVPIRYGRMAVSPFTFFRGAAAIMAADLAHEPASDLRVQVCGDAHLVNFGVFAAPDRKLVFDLNDFDETLPAPFEWDVKRLAASVVVAARDNENSKAEQRKAGRAAAAAYRKTTSELAERPFLDTWYARMDVEPLLDLFANRLSTKRLGRVSKELGKAERRTNMGALERFAEPTAHGYRIRAQPPVIVPIGDEQRAETEARVVAALERYEATMSPERRIVLREYRFADVARKVSGVGSVGTEGFMVLMLGKRTGDPLFLQFKEAKESVLAPYAGASEYENEGERVVVGQRVMQAASDSFLGWATAVHRADTDLFGKDFYGRQLRDKKGAAKVERMSPDDLELYARLCGACLARAHARSGKIAERAEVTRKGHGFAREIADFAVAYADKNESDYEAMLQAEADGRIEVQRGV